jgi:hypothetical protein
MDAQPRARFAMATFDSWQGVAGAVADLRGRGVDPGTIGYLALGRVLAADAESGGAAQELPFPQRRDPVSCTPGVLAHRLEERIRQGAPTLRAAIGAWFVERHADEIEAAVEEGRILVWVQLFSAADERRACQGLLAHSSDGVGVNDLPADAWPR